MLVFLLGTISNLIGFTASLILGVFSFRVGRLGDKRAYLFSLGGFLLSFGFLVYGVTFSIEVSALLRYQAPLSFEYFHSYWYIAAFLFLFGYLLLAVSYTIHSARTLIPYVAPFFSFLPFLMVEQLGTLLTFYLFIIVTFNTWQSKQKFVGYSSLGYLFFFIAQVITTSGIASSSQLFYWGIVLRGIGSIPLLLVALRSKAR